MKLRKFLSMFAVVVLAGSAFAGTQEYKIDSVHSSVGFSVKHMLVSTVKGRFTDFSGTILYDDQDPTKSSVSAVIKTASVNTDNSMRDGHLQTADFFDAQKYPEMRFQSTKVEKRGNQLVAVGNLTIKDVTKQIELPFTLNVAEIGGQKRIGVDTSELKINRFDYHVSFDDPTHSAVGKDVAIGLNLEASAAQAAATKAAASAKK